MDLNLSFDLIFCVPVSNCGFSKGEDAKARKVRRLSSRHHIYEYSVQMTFGGVYAIQMASSACYESQRNTRKQLRTPRRTRVLGGRSMFPIGLRVSRNPQNSQKKSNFGFVEL